MTNSYAKGNAFEKEVKDHLESQGYKIKKQNRKVMFLGPGRIIMKGDDIFGADMIARKQGEKDIYIQVSTHENKSKKVKQLMEWPWTWEYHRAQVWGRIKGKKEFEVWEGPEFKVGITVRLKSAVKKVADLSKNFGSSDKNT